MSRTMPDLRKSHLSHPPPCHHLPLCLLLLLLLLASFPHPSLCSPRLPTPDVKFLDGHSMMGREAADVIFSHTVEIEEGDTANAGDGTNRVRLKYTVRVAVPDEMSKEQLDFKIIKADPELYDHFEIEVASLNTANVYVIKPLDREELVTKYPQHIQTGATGDTVEIDLTIQVSSSASKDVHRFIVIVTDSNDEKPIFETKDSSLTKNLDENTEPDAVNPLMHVRANDKDAKDNGAVSYQRGLVMSYAVDGTSTEINDDPGSWFRVKASNGEISVQRQIDREETERFTIVVIASDGGKTPQKATATVTIIINDVNDNPPKCEVTSFKVLENSNTDTLVGLLKCSDADKTQSDENKFSMTNGDGSTCPFTVNNKGEVSTGGPLDRETDRRHICKVRVEDPGKPDFYTESVLTIDVLDVDDCAPKPREDQITLGNEVNETISIEFIDEDEGEGDITVELTKGSEYFEIPDGRRRRRRRDSAASLRRSFPAADKYYTLRQTKKLPLDFTEFKFRTEDEVGNVGDMLLAVTFPQQRSAVASGNAFPWWIIIVVAIVLIILILAFVFYRRRRQSEVEAAKALREKEAMDKMQKGVEGYENEYEERKPFLEGQVENGIMPTIVELDGKSGKAIFLSKDDDGGSKTGSQTLNPAPITIPEEEKIHKPKDPAQLPEGEEEKEPETNDELLEFGSEGEGSKAGSLSSLESIADEDVDFVNVAKWGPQFRKLTNMMGDLEAEEEEQKRVDEIEDNFLPTQEEDSYYLRCFKACDQNNTGHVTATELLEMLQWMNENPFGERKKRLVDATYVEQLRWKYDLDHSLTFDFPEFINLMKGEKIAFAEMLFKEADFSGQGKLTKTQVQEALKKAGYTYKGTWASFLDQFDKDKDNFIDYDEFSAMLRSCFAKELVKKKE